MAPPPRDISGEGVHLRLLGAGDRPRLREILAEPEVSRWWAPRGVQVALDGLYDPDEVAYVIEVDGVVAGAIEYSEENEPDYRHASIDIFLGSAHQGRGFGRDAVRALARYLVTERGHHRLTIDPAVENERAIRAYRRVGFRPVGVMRSYERGSDGAWHDGLLMDLLADELADDP